MILFVLGCITFFFLLLFDTAAIHFESSLNIYSIYGCVVVMINYIMTDTAESRIKKRKKQRKESIDRYKEKCNEVSVLIEAIEAIEQSTALLEKRNETLQEES